jgi:hypothetical protein
MTSEHTGIMTVGKPAKDPNALKIASFRTKEGVWAEFCQKAESINLTATDVIKAAMEQFINGDYTPYSIHTAVSTNDVHHDSHTNDVLTKDEVIDIVNTAVNTLSLPNHDDVMTLDTGAIEKLVIAQIEPLAALVAELETYTQSQFAAMRDELRAISNRSVTTEAVANVPTIPHKANTDVDSDTRTWCGFFEMVGIKAMTATEAQKKENIDIRTQQIEHGLRAAIDQGLGEWAVKRAGRDFVRIAATLESTLPLFTTND